MTSTGLLGRFIIALVALILASISPGLGTIAGAMLIGLVLGSTLPIRPQDGDL